MFILKAYELMLATGDLDSLKKSWSAIKKTGERLLQQSSPGKLPLESHSTYDQKLPGKSGSTADNFETTPEYCGSIALPSYLAMAEMAKFVGENDVATKFLDHYKAGRSEFKQKYGSSSTFGTSGRFAEGHIAGYSWANYLCLEPIMDEDFISSTCKKMRDKQKSGIRANGEWVFYDVDHYGGSEIAINQPDAAMVIHKQDYDYYYKTVPGQVHWQSLQAGDGNTGHDSYMTAPTVWHSYFQFCGYMIDNAFNRLWIRPRIPTEMNKKITNALLLNPKTLGTLDYDETPDAASGRTQTITVKYDTPVTIKEIILKNNSGSETPYVLVAGASNPTVKAEGTGLEKNIRVTLATPIQIGPEGVKIDVYSKPVAIAGARSSARIQPIALKTMRLSAGAPIHYSVDAAGMASMELFTVNGARIGTIMQEMVASGAHSFMWNGKTVDGKLVGSAFVLLRLSTQTGSVTQSVITGR
jgi:hypothetical protein